jgi:RND family efflux transporter MFP subunit
LALTSTHNTIDYLSDRMTNGIPNQVNTDKNILNTYISQTTSHISKLSAAGTAIDDAENSATSAELSLKSAELTLNQAQDSVKNAKETLANHTIVAPFDGVISKVPVELSDKVSANSTLTNIITNSMKVSISLNEVDAAKISIGDKATLTFDAIDNLTMEGTVYEIDVVGAVTNGVVSYGVNISFDSTDSRIKAGMTTSVSISAKSIPNVLAISSAAISTKNGKSFVLVPAANTTAKSTTDKTSLKEVEVKTGLSSDELTEVTGGLVEDDTYVASTKINATSKSASGSLFSMFGPNSRTTRTSTSSSSAKSTSSSGSKTSATNASNQNQSGGEAPMPPQ